MAKKQVTRVLEIPAQPIDEEVSGPQITSSVSISTSTGIMHRSMPATYAQYRALRKDATVALARGLGAGPILAGSWSVEANDGTPDEWVDFIRDTFLDLRPMVYWNALLFGNCDFGWMPFEKVYRYDGRWLRLAKLKPLLHDLTDILVDEGGTFTGFRCTHPIQGGYVDLPRNKCLLIYFRPEGTDWHGTPLLENARPYVDQWGNANDGADRYDRKLAGSHWIIYYPDGVATYNNIANTPNGEIAADLLRRLESSGSIAIPMSVKKTVKELNTATDNGWKVEILDAGGGQQASFIDRLRYLDTLKTRALMMPERSILEGQFGTKAETGAMQDLAVTWMQLVDWDITRLVNWYAVDEVLAMNFGEEARGSVYLVASPLVDAKLTLLQDIYKLVMANPTGFVQEYDSLDMDSLKEKLGIPRAPWSNEPTNLLPQPPLEPEQVAIVQENLPTEPQPVTSGA